MKSSLLRLLVLPLTIVGVLYVSLFLGGQKKSTNTTNQITSKNPIELKTSDNTENNETTKEKKEPSNPTPENIKVLGVEDIQKITDSQSASIEFETQILYNLINSYREENNLNKLFANKLLEDSARRKLKDMIDKNYFRHADTANNESWYLFNAAGYHYELAGENLSTGYNTPWQVFSAWQRSEKHNSQLLKPEYLDMGLAVNCETYEVRDKPACIVVLHLGLR